jgi:hypothetical protein
MTPFRAAILLSWMALFLTANSNAQILEPWSSCDSVSFNAIPGHPYAAVQETETTSTPPGGTRIVSRHQCRLYRDAVGRMRWETFGPIEWNPAQKTPDMVSIFDQIAQLQYFLRPPKHTASVRPLGDIPRELPLPLPLQGPDISDDVEQYVLSRRAPYAKTSSENLGTQMMNGLLVSGERTTWSLPTSSWENDRPTVTVYEVWTSTDLHFTVLSQYSDSRGSQVVTRTISLDRSEPDPALFRLPPDYTIVDASKNQ